MNYSFVIRRATPEDAPAIKGIITEAFTKYMQDTGLTDMMDALKESTDDIIRDTEDKYVYIALIDDIPAGTVRAAVFPDGTAYVSRFGVSLQYHNIGIGKALMNLVDKLMRSKGVKKVSLHTASKYADLVRFYYGRGYYIESTSTDRGYVRALMVKEY